MNDDINENLRELCAVGDLQLVKSYTEKNKPDLNSQNKVNGWYLVQNGASNEILNKDLNRPSFYARENVIKELFNEGQATVVDTAQSQTEEKFVPGYLKYPDFSHLRHFDEKAKSSIEPAAVVIKQEHTSSVITVKIRLNSDSDFIEIDLDKDNTTFEQFKLMCLQELDATSRIIEKIRKLPNVLIRNDRDIKRFKNEQEFEIVCI